MDKFCQCCCYIVCVIELYCYLYIVFIALFSLVSVDFMWAYVVLHRAACWRDK